MSNAIGTIIDGGKPLANGPSNGSVAASGGNSEPEIINGFEAIEPDTEPIAGNGTGTGPRRTRSGRIDRRTRAGRSGNIAGSSPEAEKESVHLGSGKIDLASAICGIHSFLAEISGIEELEIDDTESKLLADATTELGKQYNVYFDPKKVAMFNFVAACGKVYVPRVIAIKNNAKKKKQPAQLAEVVTRPATKPNGVERPAPKIDPIEMLGGAADIEQ